jgi:signal recognition particle subunit SRP54
MGEKLDELAVFHPDRMAQRILGMGDVLTLVEQAQEAFDEMEAKEMQRKLRKATFTLDDFLKQMRQVKKMGSLSKIMKFIPGMGQLLEQIDEGEMEKSLKRTEAIISSMTLQERENPQVLNGGRRARVAKGSGTSVPEVNSLLKEFDMTRRMMKEVMGGGGGGMMGAMGGAGGPMPGGGGGNGMGHGKGKGKSKKDLKKMKKKKSR